MITGSIPPLQAPVPLALPGHSLKLVRMLQRVRDFSTVSRVLGHFLTSPPFYLAFKQTPDASKSRLLTIQRARSSLQYIRQDSTELPG